MTSDESFLTKAPITPSDVSRRYSNGLDLDVVLRKGYRNSGICAIRHVSIVGFVHLGAVLPFRNKVRVSL